jgi:hypothetical protein
MKNAKVRIDSSTLGVRNHSLIELRHAGSDAYPGVSPRRMVWVVVDT